MTLSSQRLRDIARELATRPGHDKVRVLCYDLLVYGLEADSTQVQFEHTIKEVRGRADALLGRTIFEMKADLRYEEGDAEGQLARYIEQRESESGERFVGIATDGATFVPYELVRGKLMRLADYRLAKDEDGRDLLRWLAAAVALKGDLRPDFDTIRTELGRSSLAYHVARLRLEELWADVGERPEAKLKRDLWAQRLELVYGTTIDSDQLFFQHTYLTIVTKAMAVQAMGLEIPAPDDLLSGKPFSDAGIEGAVESDFFDWVLESKKSEDLINRIAGQVRRFRLREIENDVLKVLYESLIDPEQRHELGEYYTPDWLASKMCERVIERPLDQRVLDPACGSGTFLFHAIRRYLRAAEKAKVKNREAIKRCCEQIIGVDVHPVAVLIARVTYLLAIGEDRLRNHPPMSIPVYLGESLQWNTEQFLAEREVLMEVPDGPLLHFPWAVARNPGTFDEVVQAMLDLSERKARATAFEAWLKRNEALDARDVSVLSRTYQDLYTLREAGRNHIWGYVARNLSRPVWLSSDDEKAEVVIGNPPWLSYRYMSAWMKERFKKECEDRDLWSGGKVATHQDLSAYFFARCTELYLKPQGTIAFVMPYAALNRKQFEGFRRGWFGGGGRRGARVYATIRFTEAWAFDEGLQPLFPVPSCVLLAVQGESGKLPPTVMAASGVLPLRDASPAEAKKYLTWQEVPWPSAAKLTGGSAYRSRFHQGATMVPRLLCVVERAESGRLGGSSAAPLVQSRRTRQEKTPWKDLPARRGTVEKRFLRPMYLGESIAPFRPLASVLTVVPWDEKRKKLLDAAFAETYGYIHLGKWLKDAERLWRKHSANSMALTERWDYQKELTRQFPPPPVRVLYAASGTVPAACVLEETAAIAEHKLYWAGTGRDEASFLTAILNSEVARSRVAHLQSRGQWGARDFDKLMFELPIPLFNKGLPLHMQLADAAERAAEVASGVTLPDGCHFIKARKLIRQELQSDGIAGKIETLVGELLK